MSIPDDCLFCRIVSGELLATRVYEDDRTVAVMAMTPATRGHVWVIPRVHSVDLLAVDSEDLTACTATAQLVAGKAVSRLGADGVNLWHGGVDYPSQRMVHFHLHVVPRYEGDGLRNPLGRGPSDPAYTSQLLPHD